MTTLEEVFRDKKYPALAAEVTAIKSRIQLQSGADVSVESSHARLLIDDLKHLAVLAFDLPFIPV